LVLVCHLSVPENGAREYKESLIDKYFSEIKTMMQKAGNLWGIKVKDS